MNQNRDGEEMPSRNLGLIYQLDANRINAEQLDSSVNQLEEWHKREVIFLEMSRTAYDEAGSGKGPLSESRREKADDYTFVSATGSLGADDWRKLIEQIVFPGGAKQQDEGNDVSILLDAKMAGPTLVTSDRTHIIKKADTLLSVVGIRALTAKQAVNEVKKCLRRRDAIANKVARATGCEPPEWVGKD